MKNKLFLIETLDLAPIKRKLMLPTPEGKGWTQEQADEAELWYKRFLTLCADKGLGFTPVPNGPIDDMWHTHILDTRKYIEDCNNIFDEYLHHYPYFGLNGDAEQRDDAFVQTNLEYLIRFGEDCTTMFGNINPSYCGTDDKVRVAVGQGCNHAGSGTGCGQR